MRRFALPVITKFVKLACASVALGALVSCQSTAPGAKPSLAVDYRVPYDYMLPDSASWRLRGAVGNAFVVPVLGTTQAGATFEVAADPGVDTVFLSNWKYGIRTSVYPCVGSTRLTVVASRVVHEHPAMEVLKRHAELVKLDPAFFGTDRQGARRSYAKMLVDADTLVKGYPAIRPYGIDSIGVVDEICVALARKKMKFTSLVTPSYLGSDSANWHKIVLARIKSRILSSTDSAVLFPPTDIAAPVATRITLGGMVVYDSANYVAKWRVTDNVGVASVTINGKVATKTDTATYSLSNALLVGSNVIRLVASDAAGNSVRDSIVVVRLARDTVAPVAVLDSTARTRTVPYTTGYAVSAWRVTDASNFVARINDSVVIGSYGVYSKATALAVGVNVVRMMAIDVAGNVTRDSVVVIRTALDTTKPVAVRDTLTRTQTVANGVLSFKAGWRVSDASSFVVRINDSAVAGIGGLYSKTLPLSVGANVVRLVATDAAGNVTRDSVVITRAASDTTKPVVVRDTLTRTQTVAYNVASFKAGWRVSDASSFVVRINDSAVAGIGGLYSKTLPLSVGANSIRLLATDAAGNITRDSIVITRMALDSFAATWRIDSTMQTTLVDQSGHGLDLNLAESGKWTRAFDSSLTSALPSGKILYTAKVYMTSYPDSAIYNKVAVVMGFYEGMKMGISVSGQLMVAGQKNNAGSNTWYGPRSINGAVPLNKWTTLAVGTDQATGEFYAWIDGVPVRLYSSKTVAGTKIRVAASTFALGADATDGQKFMGKIAEAKVINKFIYGAGLAVKIESCIENLCANTLTPNAFWRPDSVNQTTLSDKSGHGLALNKVSTGIWSRAFDTTLVAMQPSGRILYTTQVKLTAYPASTIYNKTAVVAGFYEGMKLGITVTGQLLVAGQRGVPTANTWYGPRSVAGAVPLNRWVTLAVGTDQATGEFYAWIDGIPQRLYSATTVAGTKIRVATTSFGLGADLVDGQKFEGQIGEVKVWNNFIYGPGLTVGLDPTIAN